MKYLSSLLFSLIISSSAYSETLQQNINLCGDIENNSARLSCFDALTKSIKTTSAVTDKITQSSTTHVTSVNTTQKTQITPQNKQSTIEDQFGANHLKQKNKTDRVNERITLTVSSISKDARKRLRITFENDQVWKQSDNVFLKLKTGDKVELYKGVLGVIYLKKSGKNKKIRVKRLK